MKYKETENEQCSSYGALVPVLLRGRVQSNECVVCCHLGFCASYVSKINLLSFKEYLTEDKNRILTTDVIYFDSAKSFNCVPRKSLFPKLEAYGF